MKRSANHARRLVLSSSRRSFSACGASIAREGASLAYLFRRTSHTLQGSVPWTSLPFAYISIAIVGGMGGMDDDGYGVPVGSALRVGNAAPAAATGAAAEEKEELEDLLLLLRKEEAVNPLPEGFELDVTCGKVKGKFLPDPKGFLDHLVVCFCKRCKTKQGDGTHVTLSVFVAHGGLRQKWRTAIVVTSAENGGEPEGIGAWLDRHGVGKPKGPSLSTRLRALRAACAKGATPGERYLGVLEMWDDDVVGSRSMAALAILARAAGVPVAHMTHNGWDHLLADLRSAVAGGPPEIERLSGQRGPRGGSRGVVPILDPIKQEAATRKTIARNRATSISARTYKEALGEGFTDGGVQQLAQDRSSEVQRAGVNKLLRTVRRANPALRAPLDGVPASAALTEAEVTEARGALIAACDRCTTVRQAFHQPGVPTLQVMEAAGTVFERGALAGMWVAQAAGIIPGFVPQHRISTPLPTLPTAYEVARATRMMARDAALGVRGAGWLGGRMARSLDFISVGISRVRCAVKGVSLLDPSHYSPDDSRQTVLFVQDMVTLTAIAYVLKCAGVVCVHFTLHRRIETGAAAVIPAQRDDALVVTEGAADVGSHLVPVLARVAAVIDGRGEDTDGAADDDMRIHITDGTFTARERHIWDQVRRDVAQMRRAGKLWSRWDAGRGEWV